MFYNPAFAPATLHRMPWPLPIEYEIKGKGKSNTFALQIETTDHEIDRLVYELYGLTAEEIKIVEGESSHIDNINP